MRLWSLHPQYLDRQGLLACWREGLLAQAVLLGQTSGYRHHPQLTRFQASSDPLGAIGLYLCGLADAAKIRGYAFDREKIQQFGESLQIPVTSGQIIFEWGHLATKLQVRDPAWLKQWEQIVFPELHPLFTLMEGPLEPWEKTPRG